MEDACKVEDENLNKLRALTKELRFSGFMGAETYRQVKTAEGKAFIGGMFKSLPIAVVDNYSSAGTDFPMHQHPGWEIFYVTEGQMDLNIEGEEFILKEKSRPFVFDARQPHGAYFPIETKYLAVTIPGDKDWPNGG